MKTICGLVSVLKKAFHRAALLSVVTMLFSGVSWADVDEAYAEVKSLDIRKKQIVFDSPMVSSEPYRLAFDLMVYLPSGDRGTLSSVKRGDEVNIFVDRNAGTVHKISIIEKIK